MRDDLARWRDLFAERGQAYRVGEPFPHVVLDGFLQPDVLVIDDATADPRFADNPLVTSDPLIRFYAGAPLILPNGYAVGTLCIIDTRPRSLDAIELSILSSLRDLLVKELSGMGGNEGEHDHG